MSRQNSQNNNPMRDYNEHNRCSECGEYNIHCTCVDNNDESDPIDIETGINILKRVIEYLSGSLKTDEKSQQDALEIANQAIESLFMQAGE